MWKALQVFICDHKVYYKHVDIRHVLQSAHIFSKKIIGMNILRKTNFGVKDRFRSLYEMFAFLILNLLF